MSFAGAKILSGIMLVGAVIVAQPVAAYAQSCNGGSANAGDVLPFNPAIDYSQLAQFTLDSSATDVSMLIVDDQNNVACDTSQISANHLSCNWMPSAGATYTVQVLRPVSQATDTASFNLCSMGATN